MALRTQQIIAFESGAADTVDPLAGSYAIESLTDKIEQRASSYLDHIDHLGGALRAIELGYIQNEIQDAAYRYQQAVERHEQIVVGVNDFVSDRGPAIERLRVDPAIETRARERLAALRARRDPVQAAAVLARLEAAAAGSDNLMPVFVECVSANITVGEICGCLRKLWGEYRPTV